jgi:hypothetical protein
VDATIFEPRYVHPVDDWRRAWRTEPPEQSPDVVVASRRKRRGEFEFGRDSGLQRCYGIADRLVSLELLFGLKENSIRGIDALDRCDSALTVPLAEYLREIPQQKFCQWVAAQGILLSAGEKPKRRTLSSGACKS